MQYCFLPHLHGFLLERSTANNITWPSPESSHGLQLTRVLNKSWANSCHNKSIYLPPYSNLCCVNMMGSCFSVWIINAGHGKVSGYADWSILQIQPTCSSEVLHKSTVTTVMIVCADQMLIGWKVGLHRNENDSGVHHEEGEARKIHRR